MEGLAVYSILLIDYTREFLQNYFFKCKYLNPVGNIIWCISSTIKIKTQFGSARPYGAEFLFGSRDKNYGSHLYNVEPSGIYNGWRALDIWKNVQIYKVVYNHIMKMIWT